MTVKKSSLWEFGLGGALIVLNLFYYLGHTKSSGPGTLFSYNRLIEIFFLYEKIERVKLYFPMLFDHFLTANIITKFQ